MVQIALNDGTYLARSVIESAQRCVNMYPQKAQQNTALYLPQQMTDTLYTHYPTPGLTLLATIGLGPIRGIYTANNGSLYAVSGSGVFVVDENWSATLLGEIDYGTSPVIMADNSLQLVLVDGTQSGYAITLNDSFLTTVTTVYTPTTGTPTTTTQTSLSASGTLQTIITTTTITVDESANTSTTAVQISTTPLGGETVTTTTTTTVPLTSGTVPYVETETAVTTSQAKNTFQKIDDPAFYGADGVDYIDAFLFFNKPGTPQFYCTTSETVTPFDANYFANKTGYADNLVRAVAMHREIWLIGEVTTEVWYDAGGATFPFAEVPGAFIQHGCAAKFSVAVKHEQIFWLSKNLQGECIVLCASGYDVARVSTHAIEWAISQYETISDAIGFIYQEAGHEFYVLTFPTADKTWVYDNISGLWHERMWLDSDGKEHRVRANCAAFVYGKNVCGDWQNGNLYLIDQTNYTDNGEPIRRIRSFPVLMNELKRIGYNKFIADMQVGSAENGASENAEFLVALRYSDTGGQSWSDYIYRPVGGVGQFLTTMQWRRLGLGRRRVFELSWSTPVPTALNGAYIDITPAAT